MKTRIRVLISIGSALSIAACASMPKPNAALEAARTEVQTAQANPNVIRYAPVDLDAAKKQLDVAQAAYLRHDDPAVAQPAYLATQMARLAEAHGAAKADDARVAAGRGERDRIQLDARTRRSIPRRWPPAPPCNSETRPRNRLPGSRLKSINSRRSPHRAGWC